MSSSSPSCGRTPVVSPVSDTSGLGDGTEGTKAPPLEFTHPAGDGSDTSVDEDDSDYHQVESPGKCRVCVAECILIKRRLCFCSRRRR